jgi:hypothetical protein
MWTLESNLCLNLGLATYEMFDLFHPHLPHMYNGNKEHDAYS